MIYQLELPHGRRRVMLQNSSLMPENLASEKVMPELCLRRATLLLWVILLFCPTKRSCHVSHDLFAASQTMFRGR